MAKIRWGAIITDSRGRVGGTTLKLGPYGSVMQSATHPPRKLTPHATTAKAIFATYSKRWWSELTSTQRDDWRTLAAANPITNPWGDEFPLTGHAYYVKLNSRLTAAGLATTDDAPADQSVLSLSTVSMTATAPDSLEITFTPTPIPTAYLGYLFATPPRSPGATNFSGRLVFLGTIPASTASPVEVGALYTARLGQIYTGRNYAVSLALLNQANAALSPPILASATAT